MARQELTSAAASTMSYNIGDMVVIESRTWPGINKPGGVAKVTKVDGTNNTVDVKYTLGGGEKGVELVYVEPWDVDLSSGSAPAVTLGRREGRGSRQQPQPEVLSQPQANKASQPSKRKPQDQKEGKENQQFQEAKAADKNRPSKDDAKKHKVLQKKVAVTETTTTAKKKLPTFPRPLAETIPKATQERSHEKKITGVFASKAVARQARSGRTTEVAGNPKFTAAISRPSAPEPLPAVQCQVLPRTASPSKLENKKVEQTQPHVDSVELDNFIAHTARIMNGAEEMELDDFLPQMNANGRTVSEKEALKYFKCMEERNIAMFIPATRTLYRIT